MILDVDPALPPAVNINAVDVLAAAGVRIRAAAPFGPSGFCWRIRTPDGRLGAIFVTQGPPPVGEEEWLHASIAFDGEELPTYGDLALLHRVVFGRRRYAYQVFAPVEQHVDIHPAALHLWGRPDGTPCLPEFGAFGTI